MKLKALFAASALLLLAVSCNKQPPVNQSTSISVQTRPIQDTMNKEGVAASQDAMRKDAMVEKHGSYKDYSPDTVASEQKAGQKIVLFFYASWCPFCRAADAAFKANVNKIPVGVTVLKTDYDKETALKRKYGVTYQHTFVQIDTNGSLINKWVSGDIDLLVKNVK